jgi:uncharacterized protein (DUF486 family)
MKTVLLLIASNAFMTMAWYGHLKYPKAALLLVIAVSWCIALPEYILQVPANRIGQETYGFTGTQLKVIQEVISVTVFAVFAFFYFGEMPTWRTALAFALIVLATFLVLPNALSNKGPVAQPPPATSEQAP